MLIVTDNSHVIATATINYIQVPPRGVPYALLEGLVVDDKKRNQGIGTKLFTECTQIAKEKKCYKMIFTSGDDRKEAHDFYQKLGFKKWGLEFRKDL